MSDAVVIGVGPTVYIHLVEDRFDDGFAAGVCLAAR
jgi:hypothetical protein